MKASWHLRIGAGIAALLVATTLAAVLPAVVVHEGNGDRIYGDVENVPAMPVAIVFGAGLQADGQPTWMLADRIAAAVQLYKSGKVRRLLMSGDNSRPGYDEVSAMKRSAVAQGVPAGQVNLDYAGFRTYDSCYRARAIFGIERAVLVTQRYHLPRALFLARAAGIDAVGLAAGRDNYPRQSYYNLREFAAASVAWYQVSVTHPRPRYLGEPVDLEKQNGG